MLRFIVQMEISILAVNKIEAGIFSTDYILGKSPTRIFEMQRFWKEKKSPLDNEVKRKESN